MTDKPSQTDAPANEAVKAQNSHVHTSPSQGKTGAVASGPAGIPVSGYTLGAATLFANEDSGADADPDSMGNHWSVPWADLMMVMFVLFAALLTAQALHDQETRVHEQEVEPDQHTQQRSAQSLAQRQPNFEPLMRINVFERSQQAVREANVDNVEIVLMDDQSVKVSVQGPMFFELGKADLRPEVQEFLVNLAKVIQQTPYQVNVVGHTDDQPINTERFPSNWELSITRASRVARYLIQRGEIDPSRFTVMGRAQYQPAVPNESGRARALNRRVEIIITREIQQPSEDNPT